MPFGGHPKLALGHPMTYNDKVHALHSEQTLCSNPTMSNISFVAYSQFTIFRQLSGGTPLPASRSPCDRFPYDLASPADACAQGLRRTLAPPPLTSEFVGMVSYAPTTFHELLDDEV